MPVRLPVMVQEWEWVTFLHWPYEAAAVQALLPDALTVETFDGAAWVSLVLFRMRVHSPVGPAVLGVGVFPEVNLRTYVTGPDGGRGIWFLSVEAGRLPPPLAARATLALPYSWAAVSMRRRGDVVEYRTRRRWPGPRGVGCRVRVRPGQRVAGERIGPLDDFLVSRFRLYTRVVGVVVAVEVDHPPWELRDAEVVSLQDDLARAAGLPVPGRQPLAQYADGVRVRVAMPRTARSRGSR